MTNSSRSGAPKLRVSDTILDASAVLAVLNGEPGADFVSARSQRAAICSVNWTEVVSRLIDLAIPMAEAVGMIDAMELEVVVFDRALAAIAADLRTTTRSAGLSLGDRACLALGIQRRVPVLTGDRPWAALEIAATVVLIR